MVTSIKRDRYFRLRVRIEALLLNVNDDLPLEVSSQLQALVREAPELLRELNAQD
jgi:hypothetical protein